MDELPAYYTVLFRAGEQALQALDEQNFGLAKQLLVGGERSAEEAFVSEKE